MHSELVNITKSGFSLLEVTVVMLVMGLTITALLQLFQWGFIRYAVYTDGLKNREFLSDTRIWLRKKIASSVLSGLNKNELIKEIPLENDVKISELKLRNYASDTVFVTLNIYNDKNENGKQENNEKLPQRLFCFRRRTNQ